MTQSLVEWAVELLNYCLSNSIISEKIISSIIVEGKCKIDMGLKRIEFGAYAMVYVGATNTMKRRIVPALVLKA